MPWVKYLLLLTTAVMVVSSLGVRRDAFSDMGVSYDSTASSTISFGKLIIGNGLRSTTLNDTDERQAHGEAKFNLAEAKLKHLGPSVHCGDDTMTLRVPGPRMPHFLVDKGDGTKVPLSEIPPSCGYSVKRVRRDVSLVAPYNGCGHVQQQSGAYVLPLVILGATVQMSCPMNPPALPKVSCFPSGMVVSLGQSADTVKIKVDGSWQPLLLAYFKCKFTLDTARGDLVVNAPFKGTCWDIKDAERRLPMLYGGHEVILTCPDTSPTTVVPQDPQVFYQFPYGQPWYNWVPATAAPTTTTAAPQDPFPQQPYYPYGKPWWWYPQVPATIAPTTTTAAPQDPFPQQQYYPFGKQWWYYQVPTTQAPTTTTAAPQDPFPQQPYYPYGKPWWWYPQVPATIAPTTTTAAPQDPFPQQQYYPFGKQWWYYQVPATQAPTTMTAAPQDPFPQQPYYPYGKPWWWYPQVPATIAPTTTAAPQDPFPQQQYYPYGKLWWYPRVPATQAPTTAAPQDPFPQQPMFPLPIFDPFRNLQKGEPFPHGVPKFPPIIPGYPVHAPPADLPKGMQYPADMYPVFHRRRRSVSSGQLPLSYKSRR
ncbi:uncharacterized protein [Paramisgurnus dabryanus]|uniref:uncharacterized protein n=1 Tax=Paramisgurnus dabryanus TaxID=90735 RepID=UPI0031F44E75